jgi:hypothetical protein
VNDTIIVGVLSPDCEAFLEAREWYSTESQFGSTLAVIRDEEGARLFEVTRDIDAFNLSQLLRYADTRYRAGKQDGASELQYKLRSLMGAAELAQ